MIDPKQIQKDFPILSRKIHGLLLIVVAVVLPEKANTLVFDIEESMIGDGDTMGVAADIIEYLLRTGERRLGVDTPFQFFCGLQVARKLLRVVKSFQRGREPKLAGVEGFLKVL